MASTDPRARLTGGCQCGAVRYALAVDPTALAVCHCRMCQKASGGPYMVFGRVPLEAIAWTRGSLATFASSNIATRGFCARCGTPLTYQGEPEAISVTLGSLDDPSLFPPTERLGAEAVLPWSEQIADLAVTPTAVGDDFVNHQHPDRDT